MKTTYHPSVHHPHRRQIEQTIRGWFHNPTSEKGVRAVARRWGTYWDHGDVYPRRLQQEELREFVNDLLDYYKEANAIGAADKGPTDKGAADKGAADKRIATPHIVLDEGVIGSSLDQFLTSTWCDHVEDTIFLIHSGVFPGCQSIQGLRIIAVGEELIATCANVRLQSIGNSEQEPTAANLKQESIRLKTEMASSGYGHLAFIGDEAVGMLWSYEEQQDIWISQIGVLQQFRRRGIAHALLKQQISSAYSRGFRSVVINVRANNSQAIDFYRKLGFRDEVYRQRRYGICLPL